MGAVLSLPALLAPVAPLATCCGAMCVSMCTSTAASAMCKSCNCQSSIATRVGYALLFCFNALLAWISLTPALVRTLERYSLHYIQVHCEQQESCFGVMAVHRILFAAVLFHLVLAALLVDVHDTRTPRAALQNGWWGPKVAALLSLIALSFVLPNGFIVFWANWIAPLLACVFLLLGLVLLVDVAHTWSETCLEQWEREGADVWMYLLVGTTLGLYLAVLIAVVLLFVYVAPSGCALNQTLLSVHLVLGAALTLLCVHPAVQEANPRSGLAQSSMVLAYCTYLLASALINRDDKHCNPVARGRGDATRSTTALIGVVFTFVAIAYSTTRAATQSKLLMGTADAADAPRGYEPVALHAPITEQPRATEPLRIQAIRSAVQAGSLPQSALDDELRRRQVLGDDDDDEDDDETAAPGGVVRLPANDDERSGTRYNYVFFHLIFAMAASYTAMLLTDWNFVRVGAPPAPHDEPVAYIGVGSASMWIRVASSWACAAIYAWTLLAPALLPDRFGYV
ncbi:Membrane protein tms1 [Malassezia furfur]|uniref:Membrane protein tms1 n=1 Tax=Malassezia furfur TaxID=55194 RepID=A0ABY8EZV6_MALFU|nr:TMS1 [Malassezia furfur]WFD49830.1 Membrane protein tms1 [Malassezia furfur]